MALLLNHNENRISGTPIAGNSTLITIENLALAFIDVSQSTAAPNAAVPVSSVAAKGAEATIDLVLAPKGPGAISALIPDGGVTGGNKRGAGAVDLQIAAKGVATRVASGTNSGIFAGFASTASGNSSVALGGTQPIAQGSNSATVGGSTPSATGAQAVVAGGISNAASGQSAFIGGGASNAVSGTNAFCGGGQNNTVSGNNSRTDGHTCTASGAQSQAMGFQASTRGLAAAYSHSSGGFAVGGDAQHGRYVARALSTSATPVPLTFQGAAVGTTTQVVIGNNSSAVFRIQIVARRTDVAGETAAFEIAGLMNRGATAAETVLLGTTKIIFFRSVAGWDVEVSADTVNGGLTITAVGEAAKTIRWVATIFSTEVTA